MGDLMSYPANVSEWHMRGSCVWGWSLSPSPRGSKILKVNTVLRASYLAFFFSGESSFFNATAIIN
jgi:hypothetical protein